MNQYNLWVLDGTDGFHLIDTCEAASMYASIDVFFPEDVVLEDDVMPEGVMLVDYDAPEDIDGNSLTYFITQNTLPPTRDEMFA